ncbi:MAG: GTPase Era [Thermodesulfovibrionales bacterium]|nr:GTPase Era [Thermodesulfovibrionales bacterium]
MAADSNKKSDMPTFRSGYAAIFGRPNVGKSTFLNSVLGQKVSIVTPKPQTTRNRIIGIKTAHDCQIIFIDTPGIHRPRHSLGALMVKRAKEAIRDADVILLMVEAVPPTQGELHIIKLLQGVPVPVFLLINKIDMVKKPSVLPVIEAYQGLYPFREIIPISALKGDGIDIVLGKIAGLLPEGPKYYPDDLVTDQLERFMVSEIIREKIMKATEEEIPHSAAVEIIGWEEKQNGVVLISANIYVEKEGQKAIIIGKKGLRLKAVGSSARADIERLLGAKVFLELWVKVKKLWRSNKAALTELGF